MVGVVRNDNPLAVPQWPLIGGIGEQFWLLYEPDRIPLLQVLSSSTQPQPDCCLAVTFEPFGMDPAQARSLQGAAARWEAVQVAVVPELIPAQVQVTELP